MHQQSNGQYSQGWEVHDIIAGACGCATAGAGQVSKSAQLWCLKLLTSGSAARFNFDQWIVLHCLQLYRIRHNAFLILPLAPLCGIYCELAARWQLCHQGGGELHKLVSTQYPALATTSPRNVFPRPENLFFLLHIQGTNAAPLQSR